MSTKANTSITPSGVGKRVHCVPAVRPVYDELVSLSRKGNYWARLAVGGIQGLTTGRINCKNIFVKPNTQVARGKEEFFIVLPGCKATVERQANDEYKVVALDADLDYFKLQEADNKPGLYRAQKGRLGTWTTRIVKNAKIKNEKNRLIAITDGNYSVPDEAARTIAPSVGKAPMSGGGFRVDGDGFDMHFTPGSKSLGGLRNYKNAVAPLNNASIHGSAIQLARTMYEAKETPGVAWISAFGGSAVLTQAMRILADQGITLNQHTAFMYRPATAPNAAMKEALRLKLKLDRDFIKTNFLDVIGNSQTIRMIANRKKHDEQYSLAKATVDIIKHGKSIEGALSAVAGAAGMSLALPASAMPASVAFYGATAIALAKTGNTLAESWLPRLHDKVKSKL